MGKIAAVVFDVDGVLVDARDWHYEALNRALGLFGVQINRYDHLSAYDGLPTRAKLDILSRDHGLPRGLHAFINEMKQVFTMELVNLRCKPHFAHEFALSRLKAEGYVLGVASNAVRDSVHTMMRLSCLEPYFSVMLSNEDVAKSKPDPEIYLAAASRLNCAPNQCLVIEDNPNGIKSAQAAGAHVMTVRDPSEVTYDNIRRAIAAVEKGDAA